MSSIDIKIKKAIKRVGSNLMTIFAAISIFIFLVFFTFSILLISSHASAAATEKSPAEKFQEAMQYANSLKNKNVVSVEKDKDKNVIKVGSFKLDPEKAFSNPKTQENWYTDNPSQTSYYSGITKTNIHGMKKEAIAETTKDETYKDINGNTVSTPGKTIISSFQTRPLYKITKDVDYITKNNQIIKNSKDIITGNLDSDIKCKDGKEKQVNCESTYVQKICNEKARTIKRVCEKTAQVTVDIKDVIYPNCQHMVITTGYHVSCPHGYSELFLTDMIKGPTWDDIRLCLKTANSGETNECYSGHLVQCVYHNSHTRRTLGSGIGMVPKGTRGHVRISNAYDGKMVLTITNETTGDTLYSGSSFANGQVIDLPFSETQDQKFRFSIANSHYRGVATLYIERIYREKFADVNWIEEKPCDDI